LLVKQRLAVRQKWLASRKKGTTPSLALKSYAGTYRDRAYGELTISLKDGALQLKWSRWTVPLEHFHYDTFAVKTSKGVPGRLDGFPVTFALDRAGKAAQLEFAGRTFKRSVDEK